MGRPTSSAIEYPGYACSKFRPWLSWPRWRPSSVPKLVCVRMPRSRPGYVRSTGWLAESRQKGDMHDFPPAILTTGTRDLLLSNTVRSHRALRAAGVEAQLEVGHLQKLSR